MGSPKLTFIIPAYNEEDSLPKVINSIRVYTPVEFPLEIIVADNGSKDNTVKFAKSSGAKVLVDENATVAGLRNRAVRMATGQILVFLDADVLLTEDWGRNISMVFDSLIGNTMQVTGSRCGVPADPGWIERYWFLPLMHKKVKYINSGHLITTPELFNSIGGFDESLDSGEDYAFGVAAAAAGAEITNNPSLLVVHEGYPKNLQQFIRREIWHGVGECRTLEKLRTSNVAIAAILFMMLHLLAVVGFFYDERFGLAVMFIIVLICTAFAVLKHNARSPVNLLIVSILYYFYFVSRFLSCVFRNKRIG